MRVEEIMGMGLRATPKIGDKCTVHYKQAAIKRHQDKKQKEFLGSKI